MICERKLQGVPYDSYIESVRLIVLIKEVK